MDKKRQGENILSRRVSSYERIYQGDVRFIFCLTVYIQKRVCQGLSSLLNLRTFMNEKKCICNRHSHKVVTLCSLLK